MYPRHCIAGGARRAKRAFTLIELLLVVAILGTLSSMYMAPGPGGAAGGPILYLQRTNKAACEANRAAMRPAIVQFQIDTNRAPTPADLHRLGTSLPRCPEGGNYYILDGTLYCTLHSAITPPEP